MSNQIKSIISSFYQNKLHITPDNIKILKSFIVTLDKANTSWLSNIKNISIKLINNFKYNNLLPEHIINDLKLNKHKTYSVSFKLSNHIFNIQFILFHKQNSIKSLLLNMIKHVYKILFLLLTVKTKKCSLVYNINIYLHNSKKLFPKNKNNQLTNYNINTAFTWSCNNSLQNEMNIYREEEWFKVFIHECFHMFGLDFSYVHNLNIYNNILSKLFNTNINFKFFESYAETWAVILNSLYIAYNTSYKVKSFHNWNINIMKKFLTIIQQERYFSLFQTCKILKYSNISLTNSVNNINYTENTPVFSYFILKSILLFNTNHFLEWSSINNTNYLQFNIKNINSFYQLIPLLYNNKLLITSMNRILSYLNQNNNYNNYNFNNLRFSINEVQI